MGWRRRLSKEGLPQARNRAQRLPLGDLYNTSETALYAIGSSISHWRRGAGAGALDEAERNILALLEVCREMRDRNPG